MAAYEDGSYSCLPGIALIAKVLAGRCQMRYTRAAVGNGAIPDGTSPKAMTDPAGYVMDAMISAITNPVDGECQVTVQINSKDVETGFFATGILLYAEDPDEGEVPYTYLMLENEPEWIRPASSAVGKLATFELIAAVGDIDRVSAALDPNAFMTQDAVKKYLEEHNKDPDAHKTLRTDLTNYVDQTMTDKVAEIIQAVGTSSAAVTQLDITIPTTDWVADTDTAGKYALHRDIALSEVTEELIPILTLLPSAGDTAKACGMCNAARTLDGVLRVYAAREPTADMPCSLTLVAIGGSSGGAGGTGAGYTIPAASATRLGGIKIGNGLDVQSDGTVSVNMDAVAENVIATPEEVHEMLEEVHSDASKS